MRTIATFALAIAASCAPAPSTPPAAEPTEASPATRPIAMANVTPNTLAHVLATRDSQFASLRVGDGVLADYVTKWPSSVHFDPFLAGACSIQCTDNPLFGTRDCTFACGGKDASADFASLSFQALKATVDLSVPADWYKTEEQGDQGRIVTWGPSPFERIIMVQLTPVAGVTVLAIQIASSAPLSNEEREMLGP